MLTWGETLVILWESDILSVQWLKVKKTPKYLFITKQQTNKQPPQNPQNIIIRENFRLAWDLELLGIQNCRSDLTRKDVIDISIFFHWNAQCGTREKDWRTGEHNNMLIGIHNKQMEKEGKKRE